MSEPPITDYFWVKGKLVIYEMGVGTDDIKELDLLGYPSVDASQPTGASSKAGKWVKTVGGGVAWKPIKPKDLPAEFRASLLLLGVAV